ncbi:unnamed protein product [Peniophora sp. CBMAI 1063]|nr:unnamed protein product [Peniophora sp. CBMAI 1063]
MLAHFFVSAVFSSAYAAAFSVNAPSTGANGAIQCEGYEITWSGGTAPFNVSLLDSNRKVVEEIATSATKSVLWTVNKPADRVPYELSVTDATGASAISDQFDVQSSNNSACLGASTYSPSATTVASISATISSGQGPATTATEFRSASSGTASPSASSFSPGKPQALSTGEIAGVAVGAACGVVLVVGVVWSVWRLRRATSSTSGNSWHEVPSSAAASVDPFPLTRPGMLSWERKRRRNLDVDATTAISRHTAGHAGPLPITSPEALPGNGEISETTLDRLVNLVLGRLHAQEAPPSYRTNSHSGSDE